MKKIIFCSCFLLFVLSGFAQKEDIQIIKPKIKALPIDLDTLLITIPLFLHQQTTTKLKEQALVSDEIKEDYRSYFVEIYIPHTTGEKKKIEFYRKNDSTYFQRTYLGRKRIEEGKVVFVDTIVGDRDSIITIDPNTLKSRYLILQRKNLWRTGYWNEVDVLGNLWSGNYSQGKRVGKWTYSSTDRLYTELKYEQGELLKAKTPDSLVLNQMQEIWHQKKWQWCEVLQTADEDGKPGKEQWSLNSNSGENCQNFGWFIFRENGEFELIAGNGQFAVKTIEGIGKWSFVNSSNLTLRFSNQTELHFKVDLIDKDSFKLSMKL